MTISLISPVSVKPTKIRTAMEDSNKSSGREERESCYFPGCRKDADCECDICLASINATLDLMPTSAQRSTLYKMSTKQKQNLKQVPKRAVEETPELIDPTLLSTPESRTPSPSPPPPPNDPALWSTAKSGFHGKVEQKKRKLRFRGRFWRWVLIIGLIFGLEFGVSWVLRPALSRGMVNDVVQESLRGKNLSERLVLIDEGLKGFVDGDVSSCNLGDSNWKIDQAGLILNSYCIFYASPAEEVIVWGWPLRTDGLLTSGFSSRSFTVLSGSLIEWPEGKSAYVVREANSTWTQSKGSASAVQFNSNTWVIEYKQSMFVENPSFSLAVVEFLNCRIPQFVRRMKQWFWLLPEWRHHTAKSESSLSLPT